MLNWLIGSFVADAEARLSQITKSLRLISAKLETMMATLADIQAAVAKETDAEDAVLTMLQGISQQLKDAIAANDPAAMQAVVDQIDANTAKLAAAVVENTPSA